MAYEEKKRWTDFALMSSVQISLFHLKPRGDLCSYPRLLVKLTWYTSVSFTSVWCAFYFSHNSCWKELWISGLWTRLSSLAMGSL